MFLPPSTLEGVPEATAERMSHFVMQQEVDRQSRSLQQSGFQVGGHTRLAGEHRFQPQGRGVAGHGLAEVLTFFMCGLDRIRQGDGGLGAEAGRENLLRAAVRGTAGGRAVLAVLAIAVLLDWGMLWLAWFTGVTCLTGFTGLAAGGQPAQLGSGSLHRLGWGRIRDDWPVFAYPVLSGAVFTGSVFAGSVFT
jgi:hypothetical protein